MDVDTTIPTSHSVLNNPFRANTSFQFDSAKKKSTITNIIAEATDLPKRISCPFCLFDFAFDFLLSNHLEAAHSEELKNYARNANAEPFTNDVCTYCGAKFHYKGLLPKHVIRKHQKCISGFVCDTKQEGYINCIFCPYKVLKQQVKLLFIHLENKHLTTFEKILTTYNDIEAEENKKENDDMDSNLIDKMRYFTCSSVEKSSEAKKLRPILKRSSSTKPDGPATNIRRKLTFNLPDLSSSSSTNESLTSEKSFRKNPSRWYRTKKFHSKNDCKENNFDADFLPVNFGVAFSQPVCGDDAGFASLITAPFRCALCNEKFTHNALLLRHSKRAHPRFSIHARYGCGECEAKFYRNNYLVRHSTRNHQPRCLREISNDI